MFNFDGDHQYFVNYEKNEVYKLINPLIKDLFYGNSIIHQVCNSFAIGNKIYYTKIGDSAFNVYSFDISMKDFVKEPYPFYESSFNNKPTTYAIGGLLILLIGGSIFYVIKKRKKTQSNLEYINTLVNKDEDPMEFNLVELDLIKKMIVQTKKGSHFSVDDINSSLGINKKTLEIQKKIRTETINRINHKFKIKYNLNVDLIERIRSEEDRRFYKYIINENNGKMILS
jgi:LPXTG-motif cell wall-anchored protein